MYCVYKITPLSGMRKKSDNIIFDEMLLFTCEIILYLANLCTCACFGDSNQL